MKIKHLFCITIICFSLQNSFAQKRTAQCSSWEVSAGIGLLPTFIKDKGEVELAPFFCTMDYNF